MRGYGGIVNLFLLKYILLFLRVMSALTQYISYLDSVIAYINDYYGIALENTHEVRFSYLELACTTKLSLQDRSFLHIGSLFMHFLPNTFKMNNSITDVKDKHDEDDHSDLNYNNPKLPNAYCRANQSVEFIIYIKKPKVKKDDNNKTDNEDDKDDKEKDSTTVRFEIRLKTTKKVEQFLGTAFLDKITDDLLKEKYLGFIEKNIKRKWINWKTKTNKNLKKMIKEVRKDHPHQWIHYLLGQCSANSWKNQIPYIVDIDQIIEALPSNKDLKNNRSRTIQTIKRQMTEKGYTYWLTNDLSLIDDLLDTLCRNVWLYVKPGL